MLTNVISRVGKEFKVMQRLSAGWRKELKVPANVISWTEKELKVLANVISRVRERVKNKGYLQGGGKS